MQFSILKVVLTQFMFARTKLTQTQLGHTVVPWFILGSSYIENCFVGFR